MAAVAVVSSCLAAELLEAVGADPGGTLLPRVPARLPPRHDWHATGRAASSTDALVAAHRTAVVATAQERAWRLGVASLQVAKQRTPTLLPNNP